MLCPFDRSEAVRAPSTTAGRGRHRKLGFTISKLHLSFEIFRRQLLTRFHLRSVAKSYQTIDMSAPTEATAPDSGVTPDALKAKLAEKLDASHVEIEDMSGSSSALWSIDYNSLQFTQEDVDSPSKQS